MNRKTNEEIKKMSLLDKLQMSYEISQDLVDDSNTYEDENIKSGRLNVSKFKIPNDVVRDRVEKLLKNPEHSDIDEIMNDTLVDDASINVTKNALFDKEIRYNGPHISVSNIGDSEYGKDLTYSDSSKYNMPNLDVNFQFGPNAFKEVRVNRSTMIDVI